MTNRNDPRRSQIGYTPQVIKDKTDKGHFLSKAEQNYLEMEAQQAAEQFVARHRNKGSDFIKLALSKAAGVVQQVRNAELEKQGKSREPDHDPAEQHESNDGEASQSGIFSWDK